MAELLKVREITIDTMQHKDFATQEEELKVMRFYQNDLNSAKLLINVTHDKVVTDFSTATKVQIAFLKPDGKRVFQDVQNVNQMQGKYYVVLSTQTLIAYGNVVAQLRLTFPDNKVIETCKFVFAVDESIMSDEAMKSTNEFPVIQKAIEAGEKLEGKDIDGIIAAGAKADAALVEVNKNKDQIGILSQNNSNEFTAIKTVTRNTKSEKHKITVNKSLISKPGTGNYNLVQSQDIATPWYSIVNATLGESIIVDGIKLTKVTSSSFYGSLSTRTKAFNASKPLVLDPSKKYLCSAYCLTYDKPKYFFHTTVKSNVNNATYMDGQLRRFWFVVDGNTQEIFWYVQGESGLNGTGISYTNVLYIGGFQVEEIPDVKNGIVFIGDSTVQGNAGIDDQMKNNQWVKAAGSLLNVNFFNRGIGGNTTANMIARWATDITPLSSKCKYVVIQGGINDLGKAGSTAQTILQAHKDMHALAVTDGLIPIHCNITPCNKTAADEQVRKDANGLLKTEYGDLLLDIESVVVDLYETNKLLQVPGWLGDGIHYEQLAKDAIANYIVSSNLFDVVKPSSFKLFSA